MVYTWVQPSLSAVGTDLEGNIALGKTQPLWCKYEVLQVLFAVDDKDVLSY